MLNKEEIEEAKGRILRSIDDVLFGTTYSQEQNKEDEKILLQYIKELEANNYEANNIINDYIDTWRELKDKLQIVKNDLEKDGYEGYADDVKEILEIIGGENE